LPFVEVVLGAMLIVQWHRTAMAIVAAALLAGFTALLALRISQGRRPPCACFGSLSTEPIGGRHLLRNAALFSLAVAAAIGLTTAATCSSPHDRAHPGGAVVSRTNAVVLASSRQRS
jgi:hypothetical protein